MAPALDIRNLRTVALGESGPIPLVDDVSLSVAPGEVLAVVGESGSGKTMTFLSALGLAPAGTRVVAGQAFVQGEDLLALPPTQARKRRGAVVSMVFQDPLTALNPVFTVGAQIVEVIRAHRRLGRRAARELALDVLARVHIPDPSHRIDDYPHLLSGGMRQRLLIAMAIVLDPQVLIADEPTTALDVTVQAQILDLLAELQAASGMGMVLVTHDLGLVARHAGRVAVMYGGRVVEIGRTERVFAHPLHPYTDALFRSVPHLDGARRTALPAIEGQPPAPGTLAGGCPFEPRCHIGHGRAECRNVRPELGAQAFGDQRSACLVQSAELVAS